MVLCSIRVGTFFDYQRNEKLNSLLNIKLYNNCESSLHYSQYLVVVLCISLSYSYYLVKMEHGENGEVRFVLIHLNQIK